MSHFFTKALLFLILTLSLQAKDGLSQEHLLSVSPEVFATEVSADSTIEIVFDLPIAEKSVHKHTIALKSENKHKKDKKVRGSTTLKDEKTLLFTPSEALEGGTYKVKVQKVKLQDFSDKHKNRFQKYSHKMCSYFYDDAKECSLYRYASSVKTEKIRYSFSVDDNKPKIIAITLNKSNIQLNENNQTTISVNAKYDDNSTTDITNDAEWIINNSSIVSIDKGTITPLSEGSTTLQAEFNDQTSTQISITVYKEVNGYKLPPEPDETLNNSTLLGIDVNNNGVRDDVERWIFLEMKIYNGYEKIEQTIAMQTAKSFQMTLKDPTNQDDKVEISMTAAFDCWGWYDYSKQSHVIGVYGKFSRALKDKSFNTKERLKTYWEYDNTLRGRIFTLTPTLKTQTQCEISIDGL